MFIGIEYIKFIAITSISHIVVDREPEFKDEFEKICSDLKMVQNQAAYMIGSDFQKSAWQALLQIPFGRIRSYFEQASLIGKPKTSWQWQMQTGQIK